MSAVATVPHAELTSRLRLASAVYTTGAAALVTAANLMTAAHITWIWTTLACLLLAGLCYLHLARLHAYLRGHIAACAHDTRAPLVVLWWWHLGALVFTVAAFPTAMAWALTNGPVEVFTATLTMIIMVYAVRACWHALKLTHHVLIELQQT